MLPFFGTFSFAQRGSGNSNNSSYNAYISVPLAVTTNLRDGNAAESMLLFEKVRVNIICT